MEHKKQWIGGTVVCTESGVWVLGTDTRLFLVEKQKCKQLVSFVPKSGDTAWVVFTGDGFRVKEIFAVIRCCDASEDDLKSMCET